MRKSLNFIRLLLLILCLTALLPGCAGGAVREPAPVEPAPLAEAEPEILPEPELESEPEPEVEPEAEPEDLSAEYILTFAGDCTLGDDVSWYGRPFSFIGRTGEDYGWPFRNVQEWFATDDLTFVNLEVVLSMEGKAANKTFRFHAPGEYVRCLTEGSVELVTVANNHTRDFGEEGYADMLNTLAAAGVSFVENESTLLLKTDSGLTVGVYAECFPDVKNPEKPAAAIAALREAGAEIVIYAPHWGVERYYHAYPGQIALGRACIDAGADIVFGSHTHVLENMEYYNGGVILYSMGNFSFGGNPSAPDKDTALISQKVIREADGSVHLGETTVVPCSLGSVDGLNNYQPTPLEEGSKHYERVLKILDGSFKGIKSK